MADVQAENGYTRIASELLDALCRIRINGEARQVFDTILRKTYGFQKTWDDIALSQFVLATGLKKNTVCKAISKLISMNLITQKENGGIKSYCIIKDFDKWKSLPKKGMLPIKVINVPQKENLALPIKGTTIDNITIDNKYVRFEEIWAKYPSHKGKKAAKKHFINTVKTDQDWENINIALSNYLKDETYLKGFVQNGSTWFNNWEDYVEIKKVVKTQIDTEYYDKLFNKGEECLTK